MDKVRAIYDQLWDQFSKDLPGGSYSLDKLIDAKDDNRYGITLLARPAGPVRKEVSGFLEQLSRLDPSQYYYPVNDMHITIMSIISCFSGFRLDQIKAGDYREIIADCLKTIGPFTVRFEGITASPSAVLIQGFPVDNSLDLLRDNLRRSFKASRLMSSIDSRYSIKTAHMTVARFRSPILHADPYLQKLRSYRSHTFGTMVVQRLELVFNDWYQRQAATRQLANFSL